MPKVEKEPTRFLYLGIDPGVSGGIAAMRLGEVGGGADYLVANVHSMPQTIEDKLVLINYYVEPAKQSNVHVFCVIEKVTGYIGEGQPGSAMFKFGEGYGVLKALLTALRVPYEEIRPQDWQKSLQVQARKSGESKSSFKNRLKEKAQQLFPSVKLTLNTCDAILIAEYARRNKAPLPIKGMENA